MAQEIHSSYQVPMAPVVKIPAPASQVHGDSNAWLLFTPVFLMLLLLAGAWAWSWVVEHKLSAKNAVVAPSAMSPRVYPGNSVSGQNLVNPQWHGADLSEVDLADTNISGGDLSGVTLNGASAGASKSHMPCDLYMWSNVNLQGAKLTAFTTGTMTFDNCDFRGSDMRAMRASGCLMAGCDLRGVQVGLGAADMTTSDVIAAAYFKVNRGRKVLPAGAIRTNLCAADLSTCKVLEDGQTEVIWHNVMITDKTKLPPGVRVIND